ncbi:MAG TPA: efflux RND transporter periplasmic adaptor subunit [Candidatus Polarisedimenticolia bacterium]|nr:efflux RND transporter periplasmic adaptor subunit [Candidatus Polarisedimenticolia bacterium]
MKRVMVVAPAVSAVALAGAAAVWWASTGDDAPGTARVKREDFRVMVDATGTLETAVAYEIGPPSVPDFWEYNLTWMIPEGSRVKQGDIIARFDATLIEDRLREHRATRETAVQEKEKEERNLEVSLKQLRLDLVKAEGELEKMDIEVAVPEELRSSIEVEQTRLKRELAQRRVDFLREKIEFQKSLVASKLELLDVKRTMAEGKIAYHEAALKRFNVAAPVDGLVMYIPKRNGDRWEVGEGVWMLAKIMKVADIATLRVEADVLEVDSARIAVGQPAEVRVDALPQMKIPTQVSEIGRMVHEKSVQDPSKVFDAILPLDGIPTDALRPGMGIHVQIEASLIPGALTVPLEAIKVSDAGPYVQVEDGSGPQRRSVTLGGRNKERVVVESGLREGETVLLGSGA